MNQFWLVKQEPSAYSWTNLLKDKTTAWTGVRNFQARNNLKKMQKNDFVLFYHSTNEKCVVGIAQVIKEAYSDPTSDEDGWVAVDISAHLPMKTPVSLATIKKDPVLKTVPLIHQSRLSVMSLQPREFKRILTLGETQLPL
jgi:predicted RNA-binding protein with PUA-like domain